MLRGKRRMKEKPEEAPGVTRRVEYRDLRAPETRLGAATARTVLQPLIYAAFEAAHPDRLRISFRR